jgi:hypothetical protein
MLHWIAARRVQYKDVDLQEEEVKALNFLRILVEGGWVCDKPALKTLLDNSGITAMQQKYHGILEGNQTGTMTKQMLIVMQFAFVFCKVMGFPEEIKLLPIHIPL